MAIASGFGRVPSLLNYVKWDYLEINFIPPLPPQRASQTRAAAEIIPAIVP